MTSKGAGTPLDRLGFLLTRHGAITDTRIRRALGVDGLTPRHAMVLMYLEAGPMSQQTLIERLEVDPSQLVGILNDLERDELVQRRRDPADRRRHIVEMTPDGAATLRSMNTALDDVERALFADLSKCDRESLRELLGRIRIPADQRQC